MRIDYAIFPADLESCIKNFLDSDETDISQLQKCIFGYGKVSENILIDKLC